MSNMFYLNLFVFISLPICFGTTGDVRAAPDDEKLIPPISKPAVAPAVHPFISLPTPRPTFGITISPQKCIFPHCSKCRSCEDCKDSGGCAWHVAGGGHGALCADHCKDDGTCLGIKERCPVEEECKFPNCSGCRSCKECKNSGGCAWHVAGGGHGEMCLNKCLVDGTCLPVDKPCPGISLEDCCCTGVHTGNIFDLDLQKKCCPEAFGSDVRPWSKERCESLVYKTGFCAWDLKKCPVPTPKPTEEPTKPPVTTPPTTCNPVEKCLGLNEGPFPSMLQGNCTSKEGWTQWYNNDNQFGTGDWELWSNLTPKPCGGLTPIAAQCETVNGVPWDQTGLTFSTPCCITGIVCQNTQNAPSTTNPKCANMRIRYQCPTKLTCHLPPNAPKDMKPTECGCCSDNLNEKDCKKNKCSGQKKKKGKVIMKKKKCKWKKEKCSCKIKKPLEGCR